MPAGFQVRRPSVPGKIANSDGVFKASDCKEIEVCGAGLSHSICNTCAFSEGLHARPHVVDKDGFLLVGMLVLIGTSTFFVVTGGDLSLGSLGESTPCFCHLDEKRLVSVIGG
jgi:hypothetical protein